MGIFDIFTGTQLDAPAGISDVRPPASTGTEDPTATGRWQPIYFDSYDGEKNLGEIGIIKKYTLDYAGLRARSWQSYIESDVTQGVLKKFALWVIGSGLKLQSEPMVALLKQKGITVDREKFSAIIEPRWRVFSNSVHSSYLGDFNLSYWAKEAFKNAMIGGDCLVINRYKRSKLTTQIVDGELVVNPLLGSEQYKAAERRGNTVVQGVELDKDGRHVAYYVKQNQGDPQRIEARGKKSKRLWAYLVYGLRYRSDSVRGMPLISPVLETIKKLDRYKEATVGSAEQRQKIAFSIEHKEYSAGDNPLLKNMQAAYNANAQNDTYDASEGEKTANKIVETTNSQAWNMPQGAQLKMLESKNELYFADFFSANINIVCSTIGIPPEVALSKYDSNFSASRAALKDWEHTIKAARKEFSDQFYKRIYELWLDMEILSGRITQESYVTSLKKRDFITIEGFRNARFVGANVPHIDPVKEVAAERAKLGAAGANIPLTTAEQATENLGEGDYESNVEQFTTELEKAPKIEPPKVAPGKPQASPRKKKGKETSD